MFVCTCDQKSWQLRFTLPFSLAVFSRPQFNLCMRPLAAAIHSQNDRGHGCSTTFGIVLWNQAIAEPVKDINLIQTYLGPANIPEASKAKGIVLTKPYSQFLSLRRGALIPCCKPLVFTLARPSAGEQSSNTFREVR